MYFSTITINGVPVKDIDTARFVAAQAGDVTVVEASDPENGGWMLKLDMRAEERLKENSWILWESTTKGAWKIEIEIPS